MYANLGLVDLEFQIIHLLHYAECFLLQLGDEIHILHIATVPKLPELILKNSAIGHGFGVFYPFFKF